MSFVLGEHDLAAFDAFLVFGALLDEREDVSLALVFVQLVYMDEYAGLLYIAKLVVDGGAEHQHGGGEVHVGVYQGRYVASSLAHLCIEYAVVELEVVFHEQLSELLGVVLQEQGLVGTYQMAAVAKMLVEEVEYHVTGKPVVGGVHGHFAKEVLGTIEHYGE